MISVFGSWSCALHTPPARAPDAEPRAELLDDQALLVAALIHRSASSTGITALCSLVSREGVIDHTSRPFLPFGFRSIPISARLIPFLPFSRRSSLLNGLKAGLPFKPAACAFCKQSNANGWSCGSRTAS